MTEFLFFVHMPWFCVCQWRRAQDSQLLSHSFCIQFQFTGHIYTLSYRKIHLLFEKLFSIYTYPGRGSRLIHSHIWMIKSFIRGRGNYKGLMNLVLVQKGITYCDFLIFYEIIYAWNEKMSSWMRKIRYSLSFITCLSLGWRWGQHKCI